MPSLSAVACCLFVCCCAVLCRADDEADRQALVRQQNKVASLEAQLATLKVGGPGLTWLAVNAAKEHIAVRTASITLVVTRSGVGDADGGADALRMWLQPCRSGCWRWTPWGLQEWAGSAKHQAANSLTVCQGGWLPLLLSLHVNVLELGWAAGARPC